MRIIRTVAAPVVALALIAAGCGAPSTTPDRTAESASPGRSTTPPADTSAPSGPSTTIAQPEGSVQAAVIKVFDGDSLLVDIDGRQEEVRLLGINAPERNECFGTEAGDRLSELAGTTVWLVSDGEDADRFGRLLRFLFTPTSLINADLVKDGYALALQDDTTLAAQLKNVEAAAFAEARGMWGVTVCGDIPADLEISDLLANPPGPDDENLVEEWIELTNRSAEDIDIGDFIVRDESSSHRFRFPNGYVLAARTSVRLHSGCGDDTTRDVFWCNGRSVWNNGGDTVILQTPGGTVIDRLVYSDS